MNVKAPQSEEEANDPLVVLKTILLQVEYLFVHIFGHVSIIDTCVCCVHLYMWYIYMRISDKIALGLPLKWKFFILTFFFQSGSHCVDLAGLELGL